MRAYVVKRVLMIPFTLLGVTLVTFCIIKLAPGDPQAFVRGAGGEGDAEARAESKQILKRWRKERHLDEPIPVQYWEWVKDLATFDLGKSFFPPRPKVRDMLLERAPVTIGLNIVSFFIIYSLAIPIGIICAAKQFTATDRILTVLLFMLYAMPSFWVGTMLIYFMTEPDFPLPVSGYFPGKPWGVDAVTWWQFIKGWAYHGLLPVICSSYLGLAFLSRQMRSALLENIRQDYVRTARAKGLTERVVILKHALRNSLIPIVTLFGSILPAMIAGSVIIEYIFSIPGMGKLFFEAISKRDFPVVMGELVVASVLVLVGILISDILYVIVNPTISYD